MRYPKVGLRFTFKVFKSPGFFMMLQAGVAILLWQPVNLYLRLVTRTLVYGWYHVILYTVVHPA